MAKRLSGARGVCPRPGAPVGQPPLEARRLRRTFGGACEGLTEARARLGTGGAGDGAEGLGGGGGDAAVGHFFYRHDGPLTEKAPHMAYPGCYALSKVKKR